MQDQTNLLKSKRFLPLFITQFFGAFNDNAFKNAFLIWFTYDIASTSNQYMSASMMVTLAAGLFILPFFLFSATAGQLADKYDKASITKKIKLIEILLMVACSICFFTKSVYGLLVILFFMGVHSTFFGPIKYSLLPEHLHESELIKGNALIEGGTFLSILLGTLFGGLVINSQYGIELLSLCVIGSAVIGWIASHFIPKTQTGDANLKVGFNFARETWNIIKFAKKEHTVWLSILAISWFWLIGATFLTQFPSYTKGIIGGNEHIVTLFLTIFSIGIGIGSLCCNKLLKGEINGRLVPHGCIAISVSIFAFVGASFLYSIEHMHYLEHVLKYQNKILGLQEFFAVGLSSWGIVLSLLMLAIASGIYIVPLYAIMQHRSDQQYLSRIIAANNVMNSLFMVSASIATLILFSLELTLIQLFLIVGLLNIPVFFIVRRVVKHNLKDKLN